MCAPRILHPGPSGEYRRRSARADRPFARRSSVVMADPSSGLPPGWPSGAATAIVERSLKPQPQQALIHHLREPTHRLLFTAEPTLRGSDVIMRAVHIREPSRIFATRIAAAIGRSAPPQVGRVSHTTPRSAVAPTFDCEPARVAAFESRGSVSKESETRTHPVLKSVRCSYND